MLVHGARIALGMPTSQGGETAWPRPLEARLRQAHIPIDVIQESLGGDRLLTDNVGHGCTSALHPEMPALALLHPDDAGVNAMLRAIPLQLLTSSPSS